jgi:hypothetical protein
MRRLLVLAIAGLLTACGGDGPTGGGTPASIAITEALPQPNDRFRISVRNVGGTTGAYRVRLWGSRSVLCEIGGGVINPGVSATQTVTCAQPVRWIVAEVQDGNNPAWRVSDCDAIDPADASTCSTFR